MYMKRVFRRAGSLLLVVLAERLYSIGCTWTEHNLQEYPGECCVFRIDVV